MAVLIDDARPAIECQAVLVIDRVGGVYQLGRGILIEASAVLFIFLYYTFLELQNNIQFEMNWCLLII